MVPATCLVSLVRQLLIPPLGDLKSGVNVRSREEFDVALLEGIAHVATGTFGRSSQEVRSLTRTVLLLLESNILNQTYTGFSRDFHTPYSRFPRQLMRIAK